MRAFVLLISIWFGPSHADTTAASVADAEELAILVDQSCLLQHDGQRLSKATSHFLGEEVVTEHKNWGHLNTVAVAGQAVRPLGATRIQALRRHPCVRGVSRNSKFHVTSTDPRLDEQAALVAIRHGAAEPIFFHPLYGIAVPSVIAIVDTGIQADHPDLATRLWRGANGIFGHDFFNGDDDPSDDNGHGTHVAGLAASQRENEVGVRGVMGEWSSLMAVKTQSKDGGGLLSDLVNGIRWAVDQGADVINLSIAGRDDNPLLLDAIDYALNKNVIVVAASGNDGQEITSGNFLTPIGYSAARPGLIGVGAFDSISFSRPAFSNFGPTFVEIAAPGAAGAAGVLSTFINSRYIGLNGTSMAAPHVSGAAALVVSFLRTHNQTHDPSRVEALVLESAANEPGLESAYERGRRLDLHRLGLMVMQETVLDSTGGFDGF